MSTTDIHALVGAYALDAVNDIERAAFRRHLSECEICLTELTELQETAARLADTTWSVPPPRLRTNVMAAIGQTRQLSPAHPKPAKPSRWRRYTAVAAAALVLAGGAGAIAWTLQEQRVRDGRERILAAEQQQAQTRAILAAPDVVVRTSPMIGGGKVTVASSDMNDAGVILLGADNAPANGRVFELWTIRDGVATPAGVLAAGQTAAVRIVDGLPGNARVGVTLEQPGGSPTRTPTLPLVADVQLT